MPCQTQSYGSCSAFCAGTHVLRRQALVLVLGGRVRCPPHLRMLDFMRSLPPDVLWRVFRDNADTSAVATEALLVALTWVSTRGLLTTLADFPAKTPGEVGAKLL